MADGANIDAEWAQITATDNMGIVNGSSSFIEKLTMLANGKMFIVVITQIM